MVLDERSRHELYLRLEQTLGPVAASTLMEYLPPVGWADVAAVTTQTRQLAISLVGTAGAFSAVAFAVAKLT